MNCKRKDKCMLDSWWCAKCPNRVPSLDFLKDMFQI